MFLLASVAPIIVLASTVVANPIVVRDSHPSLSLKKSTGAGRHFVHGHQNRRQSQDISVTNEGTSYMASVGFGVPLTTYDLLVDTGSSNTWLGAGKSYIKTNTSLKTNNSVHITYGIGFMNGTEYTDTVTLAPNLVISDQAISVAQNYSNFSDYDGILGLGPKGLTIGTLHPDVNASFSTVIDNLYNSGAISSMIFSVFFEPTNQSYFENGVMTFGGINSTLFTGDLTYAPFSTTSPAKRYWSVDLSVRYGDSDSGSGSEDIVNHTSCVVDTGSTSIYLPQDAYDRYRNATGAIPDSETGILYIPLDKYENLKPLKFNISGEDFPLYPNAQIFPRALSTTIGNSSDRVYLVVSTFGARQNITSCILGYTFLERYYTVFDPSNQRMGFAFTQFTNSTIN